MNAPNSQNLTTHPVETIEEDSKRHSAINEMAKSELEAGTYDTVILPEGAEDQ